LHKKSSVPTDAESWNPFTGIKQTCQYYFPCGLILKEEEELKSAACDAKDNKIDKMEKLVLVDKVNINGRGASNSFCSVVQSHFDKTPLMLAAQKGNINSVKFLVNNGAKLDLLDRWGYNALDYALDCEKGDVVTYLIKCGAHPNMTYKYN